MERARQGPFGHDHESVGIGFVGSGSHGTGAVKCALPHDRRYRTGRCAPYRVIGRAHHGRAHFDRSARERNGQAQFPVILLGSYPSAGASSLAFTSNSVPVMLLSLLFPVISTSHLPMYAECGTPSRCMFAQSWMAGTDLVSPSADSFGSMCLAAFMSSANLPDLPCTRMLLMPAPVSESSRLAAAE